jgi:hypothetical protein
MTLFVEILLQAGPVLAAPYSPMVFHTRSFSHQSIIMTFANILVPYLENWESLNLEYAMRKDLPLDAEGTQKMRKLSWEQLMRAIEQTRKDWGFVPVYFGCEWQKFFVDSDDNFLRRLSKARGRHKSLIRTFQRLTLARCSPPERPGAAR